MKAAPKRRSRFLVVLIALSILVIVLVPLSAVLLRAFVLEAYKVPSGAMIPSIAVGDHLFVDKSARGRLPKRGEVIVFKFPEHPDQDFVKRAVAIAGDTLEVRAGHPFINGWEVPSCRLGEYRYTEELDDASHRGEAFVEFLEESAYVVFFDEASLAPEIQGPYYVAPGETWVLGDNRNNSHDSRMWFQGNGGGVPAANVKGRARVIWMSPDPAHKGADLGADPVAPSADLAAPLSKCLAERPPLAKTTPPPPSPR